MNLKLRNLFYFLILSMLIIILNPTIEQHKSSVSQIFSKEMLHELAKAEGDELDPLTQFFAMSIVSPVASTIVEFLQYENYYFFSTTLDVSKKEIITFGVLGKVFCFKEFEFPNNKKN
jgi:hypothetical protein